MGIKSVIIFLLGICVLLSVNGQEYNRDSIHKIVNDIRNTPLDTGHIRKLRDIGYDIGESDSTFSKEILFEALDKSFTIKDARAITNSYRMIGLWYSGVGNIDKAMDYYRFSLQTAKQNKFYYLEAGAYFNMGNIKYWKAEYDSSIDYFLKTQELFEDAQLMHQDIFLTKRILDKKKSDLYSAISSVFNTLGNVPKADEYIDKALAIAESYKNNTVIAMYTQQKADNYAENGQLEKALCLRLKHLPVMEESKVPKAYLQASYQKISQEYYQLNKIDSAKFFAEKTLTLATELEVPDAIASASLQMARVLIKEKQFSLAETYLQKSSLYFLKSEDAHEKRSYYEAMHGLMFATGRYKEAYDYLKEYQSYNDTLLVSEKAKQFSEREARYQSGKKDAQISFQKQSLRQKNILNLLLAGGLIALLAITLLAYRNYQSKQKLNKQRIAELETEKQLAATESVLKGEEKERTRLAKDLHDGLGGMLSGIKYSLNTMKGNLIMTAESAQAFERSIDMLDSSIKEMRRVAHNMMPEALVKFGLDTALNDFCNDINGSGALQVSYQSIGMDNAGIDQTTAITVYRIVQELVNNTIKHAAAKNSIVQLSKTNDILSVTVEDDGNGFDTSILQSSKGIGWDNIKNRVDFLKGTIDVNSKAGQGASVHIEFNT